MVYRHMETKEIARELGISPDGVTQRIKAAMRTLGVNKRRDAAHLLAEAEESGAYPRRVYPPRNIAIPPDPATIAPSTEGGWQSGSSDGVMREEQLDFQAAPFVRTPSFPPPIGGAETNDLGLLKRLVLIAGIAIGIALAFGALIAGVQGLTKLIWG